ncbi:GNAT family N-acetyltransferase [Consotaella aegiceratis]|uniref:GNAT family N-acetyltransferase n=1 Tax=Consotaella aegiceratis TaxID=3097961 RepID=UPI002F410858
MDIRHQITGHGGRFVAGEADSEAEMTYGWRDDRTVVFDHTFVPQTLRGRGIAGALVKAGVDWARQEGLKVVPQCSYVAAEFARKADYREIAA